MIRYSKSSDIEQVKELLYLCFGEMVEQENAYDNIEKGRYLVYEVDNKIVALTALTFNNEFRGIQISWTCTHPDYRHRGYMQELFKRLVQTTDENIYCNCWYIEDKSVNLKSLMELFGFELVMTDIFKRNINHNCHFPKDCPYKKENCHCGNNLYMRKANG